MAHLKRYVMPRAWPVAVKEETFIIRPSSGPHPLNRCMPLQILVRDVLGLAETASEARQILNSGKVMVDKKVRRKAKFPVGLMDIIEIPEAGKHYRVNVNRKGIFIENISSGDAAEKLCLITGKKTLKGGIEQINLHDGRNIRLDKSKEKGKESYGVHDSVVISLPDQKIKKHYKLEKGSPAFIFSGKNIGISGKIKEVKTRKSMTEKSMVKITSEHKEIETLKDYVFVGEAGTAKTHHAASHKEKK